MAFPDPAKTAYWSDYYTFLIPDQGYADIDQPNTFVSSSTPEEFVVGQVSGNISTIDSMVTMFCTFNRDNAESSYVMLPTQYEITLGGGGEGTINISYSVDSTGQIIIHLLRGGIAAGSYSIVGAPPKFRIPIYSFNLVTWD